MPLFTLLRGISYLLLLPAFLDKFYSLVDPHSHYIDDNEKNYHIEHGTG